MGNSKVWLIAGVSRGLGLIAVRYLLSREQTIIATTGDELMFDPALRQHPRLKVISLFPACGRLDASDAGISDLTRYIVEKFTDGLKNEVKGLPVKIPLIGAGTFQTSFLACPPAIARGLVG